MSTYLIELARATARRGSAEVIVTHPGRAHQDDFLACCVLLADGMDRVERRDPTPADLRNPYVWVVDCGGVLDVAARNLDHHQLGRDTRRSSFGLVLEALGVARESVPCADWVDYCDCAGPAVAADELGLPRPAPAQASPIHFGVLAWFGEQTVVHPGDEGLFCLMTRIGHDLLDRAEGVAEALREIERGVVFSQTVPRVATVPATDPRYHAQACAQWRSHNIIPVDVLITHGDLGRGEASSAYRYGAGVDLSVLAGRQGVLFAHSQGFFVSFDRLATPEDVAPALEEVAR